MVHLLRNGQVAQAKLAVTPAGDAYEAEADRIAAQVATGAAVPPAVLPGAMAVRASRVAPNAPAIAAPSIVEQVVRTAGQPLDAETRTFMESRLGHRFSDVRVHADALAAQSAQAIEAHAYTVGEHLVFGQSRYAPGTQEGRQLIAHELVHTLQQRSAAAPAAVQRDHYTPAEQQALVAGTMRAQAADLAMAAARQFQPGDLVFRRGSSALAFLMNEPVTHGGIYLGGGIIHDVTGLGNRFIPVAKFYSTTLGEAADASVFRVVRFIGPENALILQRLLSNIARHDYRMPTDPIPFNLFSTADDYRTATCLEYAHAQFLYAIRQLASDPAVPAATRASLRATYFTGAAAEPNPLATPTIERNIGNMVAPSSASTFGNPVGSPPPRTASAAAQNALMVGAATAMATDVNPSRFQNRDESTYRQVWPGGSGIGGTILNILMGMTYDETLLPTFTYRSFVDSRRFFQDVTPP
jgi:hypothetical protein